MVYHKWVSWGLFYLTYTCTTLCENIGGSRSQYADNTIIYWWFKPNDIQENVKLINEDLYKLLQWSSSSNLVFNTTKTETVLFGTRKLLKSRNLNDPLACTIITDKYLIMIFHGTCILSHTSSSYATLRTLAKNASQCFMFDKSVESSVLSRLDCGNPIFRGSPAYLQKRLQSYQHKLWLCTWYIFELYRRWDSFLPLNAQFSQLQSKCCALYTTFMLINLITSF